MKPVLMPAFWEALLKSYVKKTFYAGTRREDFADKPEFAEGDYRFFVRGIEKLSHSFTQERHALPMNYFNQKELRSGYLLYFLPINALKVSALLESLMGAGDARSLVTESEPPELALRLLDLGSGPGTGLFGVFHYLDGLLTRCPRKGLHLEWTLVDQNHDSLHDASVFHEALFRNLKEKHPDTEITSKLKTIKANLFRDRLSAFLTTGQYDLVLALNSLSELAPEKSFAVLEGILRNFLRPLGRMLVMEPALRITSRGLMSLHDRLMERKIASVLAPCLHQEVCPMLRVNDRDWCHSYIPWERPQWIERLDQLMGIRKEYLKCAYLLLGRKAPAINAGLWRVVSGPLNSKGKTERLLCGAGALPDLLRIMRLDRDQTLANKAMDQAERGDVLRMGKVSRIGRETKIEKVS